MKTKYDDKRLALMTVAQEHTIHKLHLTGVGLAITGVLKAMSRKQVYLIARNGNVTFQAKRGRYDYDLSN